MNRYLIRILFTSLPILPLFLNCAATTDGTAQTESQSWYYDPASPDRNAGYFSNVKSHFAGIGTIIPDDEIREYTATRHITSTPPYAMVYVGTRYVGRTNRGDLFFKPGQYTVDFSAAGSSWSEILSFSEGRNAAIMVRKP